MLFLRREQRNCIAFTEDKVELACRVRLPHRSTHWPWRRITRCSRLTACTGFLGRRFQRDIPMTSTTPSTHRSRSTATTKTKKTATQPPLQAQVAQIVAALQASSSEERKRVAVTYFPTAMRVLGVAVPALRTIAKALAKEHKDDAPTDVLALAKALIADGSMEGRQVAYELLEFHKATALSLTADDIEQLRHGLDNWASVDSFAMSVAGPAWRRGQLKDAQIDAWSTSQDRFVRRLALVCTVPLNMKSRGGKGDVPRTLRLCTRLAADRDDFVVKALSWALREIEPHDEAALRAFLAAHEATLHRRILREVKSKLDTGRKHG